MTIRTACPPPWRIATLGIAVLAGCAITPERPRDPVVLRTRPSERSEVRAPEAYDFAAVFTILDELERDVAAGDLAAFDESFRRVSPVLGRIDGRERLVLVARIRALASVVDRLAVEGSAGDSPRDVLRIGSIGPAAGPGR